MTSNPPYSVRTTAAFDRAARKLRRAHPKEFPEQYARAIVTLGNDPYNRSRHYDIRKLEGVAPGDGQYRLRLGRFRFRYDIAGQTVWLVACGIRREDTY